MAASINHWLLYTEIEHVLPSCKVLLNILDLLRCLFTSCLESVVASHNITVCNIVIKTCIGLYIQS